MKTFYLTILSVFFLSFSGCQKGQKETLNTGLVGTWEWVSTTGGIAGIHQTPQTLGYTYYVEYTKDWKYGKYDQNNHLVLIYPYAITKAISFMDNKEHNMIQLNNSTIQ